MFLPKFYFLLIDMVLKLLVTTKRSQLVSKVEGEVSGLHDAHPQPQSQGASKLCTWSPSPSPSHTGTGQGGADGHLTAG